MTGPVSIDVNVREVCISSFLKPLFDVEHPAISVSGVFLRVCQIIYMAQGYRQSQACGGGIGVDIGKIPIKVIGVSHSRFP